jgi:hypothetical protein
MFRIKNKKLNRIVKGLLLSLATVLGIFFLYVYILINPSLLFGYSVKYKNFIVYSRHELGKGIYPILDEAESNLSASELTDKHFIHEIYFCDSYSLYKFLNPYDNKYSYAINSPPHFYNIIIANTDINKNEAYGKESGDPFVFVRKLSSVIAHEATHTFIDKRLTVITEGWKIEGYCESVYYKDTLNISEAKEFLNNIDDGKKYYGSRYKKYYIAVTYLRLHEKMKFDEIIGSKLSLDEILKTVKEIRE